MKGLSSFGIFVLWLFLGGGLYLYLFEGWSLPSNEGLFYFLLGVGVILFLINSSISKVESTLMEKISNISSSEGNRKISIENEKVKDGPFEEFYPNGNLKLVEEYKNGKRDGVWKEYFEDGGLKEKGNYKDGKKNGEFEIYEGSGEKIEVLFFNSGVISKSQQFKNGKFHGLQKDYDVEGILLRTSTYEDGNIIDGFWDSYNNERGFNEKGNYLNGKKEGLWESKSEVSKPEIKSEKKDVVEKKKPWFSFFKKKQIKVVLENDEYEFFPFETRENYQNGQLEGHYESFYKNGQLWENGNYINGERDGLWESFHDNGQLEEKGNYLNGHQEGVWEGFHENGSIQYTKKFENGQET